MVAMMKDNLRLNMFTFARFQILIKIEDKEMG